MLFVNKLKVLTLMTSLVLVGQGFAGNCDANYEPPENPVWDGSTKTQPCTIGEYYIIDNAAKLAWYAKNYNSGNAKLTADIDLGGKLWTPIAAGQGNDKYTKIFDGDGHIIKNLYINGTELSQINKNYAQNLGFVGTLGNGTIKNLILENIDIQASTNAGAILGRDDSQISVGAFVGWMADKVGNTVLKKEDNVVENCVAASGSIRTTGNGQGVGGIVGNAKVGTISNCMSLVEIHTTGSQAYVGGIIGISKTEIEVSSCVYAGPGLENTGANGSVGGVVGNVYSGSVTATDSYFEGNLTYNGNAVGGVGKNCGKNCTVTNTTKKVDDTNIENVTCILNGGEWNESTNECSVTSGNWDVGGTGLSLNGYGADGYKIVFDANNGAFANGRTVTNKFFQPGMTISADEVGNPSREGYSFEGWALASNSTESVEDLGTATKTMTIYAVWELLKTITFNVAPGTFPDDGVSVKTKQVAKGDVITVEGLGKLPTSYAYCSEPDPNDENVCITTTTNYFTGWKNLSGTPVKLENLTATDDLEFDAVWETVKTYTVTYNANEHGVTTVSFVRVDEGQEVQEPTAPVAAEGYVFDAWYTEAACQNKFVFNKTIDHSYILYAKWALQPYTITYVMNGVGNKGDNQDSYTIETQTFDLTAPANVAAGNVFDGWFSDEALTTPATQVIKGSKGNKTFYAKWSNAKYKVVYKATNDVQGGASDQEKEHGIDLQLRGAGFFSFKGYDQAGWISSDGVEYALNGMYKANAPLTLYPTMGDKATYTVTYECEGCNLEDDTYTIDDELILKDDPSPVEGKRLAWYSDQAHSLQGYVPKIAKGTYGNLNLHGQRDQIYKITYVLNGSTASNNMEDYTRVDVINDVTLNDPAPREGYTFNGWYTKANFSGGKVAKLGMNSTGNKTFYAKWSDPIQYTITYENVNGATNGNVTSYTVEDAFTLEALERDGFVFGGWYAKADFEGEAVTEISHSTGNKILYAKWLEIYTITYAAGEGDDIIGEVAAGTKIEGEDATLSDVGFTREGYTQDGWMTTENGGAVEYAFGAIYTDNAALTLYPHWVINTYTVTYDAGEFGDGSIAAGTKTHDVDIELSAETFTRTGYTQNGWEDVNGDVVSSPYTENADITLYPHWVINTYTVTYNPGANGTGEEFTAVKTHGEDLTLSSVEFTREGYTQDGWMTTEDGVAVEYAFGATYTENAALTLYPHWVAVYTITYEAGEGEDIIGEVTAGTKTEGEDATLSSVGFTREGYTQTGWKTEDGSVTYDMGATYTIDASVTLYPVWLRVYTITYVDADGLENPNPTSYTVLENDLVLQPVSKPGFKFLGWFDDEDALVKSLSAGTTGDINLTAKWAEFPVVTQYGGVKITEYGDGTSLAEIDENNFDAPIEISENISVNTVVFNRVFKKDIPSTIMLPFSIPMSEVEGGKFYGVTLNYTDGSWSAKAEPELSGVVQANTPYLYRPTASTISFNNTDPVEFNTNGSRVSYPHAEWTFKGVYSYKKFEADDPELGHAYGFAGKTLNGYAAGDFVLAGAGAWLNPMRCYLVHTPATTKSANVSWNKADLPETIKVEFYDEDAKLVDVGTWDLKSGKISMDHWYDLHGRLLNGKPTTQGTYYHNGKRVIVK